MIEQREPELEEIDEYQGKESPEKRRIVRWVLWGILLLIVVLSVWNYQEMQVAKERIDRINASGAPMPVTK